VRQRLVRYGEKLSISLLFITGQIEIPAKTQLKPKSGLFAPGKVVKIGFFIFNANSIEKERRYRRC
jgi:hypothetical protein